MQQRVSVIVYRKFLMSKMHGYPFAALRAKVSTHRRHRPDSCPSRQVDVVADLRTCRVVRNNKTSNTPCSRHGWNSLTPSLTPSMQLTSKEFTGGTSTEKPGTGGGTGTCSWWTPSRLLNVRVECSRLPFFLVCAVGVALCSPLTSAAFPPWLPISRRQTAVGRIRELQLEGSEAQLTRLGS